MTTIEPPAGETFLSLSLSLSSDRFAGYLVTRLLWRDADAESRSCRPCLRPLVRLRIPPWASSSVAAARRLRRRDDQTNPGIPGWAPGCSE